MEDQSIELIKKSWEKYGECNSCGWHPSFEEVEHILIPDMLNPDKLEPDGSFWVPCMNPDTEEENHRGSYLYLKLEPISPHSYKPPTSHSESY